MGQVWRILNFDSKQTYSGGAKLGELFFKFSAEVLVSDLRVPDKVSFDEIMKVTRNAYDTKPTDYTNSETQLPEGVPLLTNLPVEIIKMSFKSIDKLQDAISLGLTCKRLLEIGLDQINRILAVSAGRWAGGRIACIGGYEGNRDMPNHVLTPEEQAILEDRDISLYEYGDSFEEVYGRCLPQCDSDFSRRLSQVERRHTERSWAQRAIFSKLQSSATCQSGSTFGKRLWKGLGVLVWGRSCCHVSAGRKTPL
ncbi:hypothetical protein FRB95_007662 [Tulasnella sp. JGI-2019a]|nr:hypothetical protein FRB95_007662 [Tulasnella sp. JGI-2019a]